MKRPEFYVSISPHVHSGNSVQKMMFQTLMALVPVVFAGWFFFGLTALKIIFISMITAVVAEFLWEKIMGLPLRIGDGSSLLTGLLLGLVLSTECPWWMPVLGACVAVIIGKELFGGLGNNPFSSVLVGWTFLQVSYRDLMSSFVVPEPQFLLESSEYLVDPPLVVLKEEMDMIADVPWMDFLLGNVPGEIGTISVIAVILGGAYLLFRRIITWHIPVSFILSAWIIGLIFWLTDPEAYANPVYHIISGWVLLGAFFIATERGTAPVTVPGMILYGIGCGALTIIIRTWGGYMEGVPFAILLMNALTPLLDRIRPRAVGRVKKIA
ncbi:MAG: RnfABCDGE type electron transport complex subunit D [Deltaproteobacteria bacterium]|nr:RnfABCDGE type electron transport complex subunit D [Deltaproteobacteria bacterium]